MLKQRVITAIILIAATLAALFYLPPGLFCLSIGLLALAGAWEWTNFMGLTRVSTRLLYLVLMALAFFNSLFVSVFYILLIAALWWAVALVLVACYPTGSGVWGRSIWWRGLMGVIVLTPCFSAVNFIRNQDDGIYAIIFLFVLIWGADSAAYFAGNKWGKRKLAPLVSPGKSIEGAIGASLFSVLVTCIALWMSHIPAQTWAWALLLSLVTVWFSIVGDLFESMLKRNVGLKDSGQLLPGHGGLLDRIDSLTAAAPIFAFGALLLGMYL